MILHTFQDIEAYTTQFICHTTDISGQQIASETSSHTNIRMVDLCQKANFRRRHGVFLWQEKFELELPICEHEKNLENKRRRDYLELTLKRTPFWTIDRHIKVS